MHNIAYYLIYYIGEKLYHIKNDKYNNNIIIFCHVKIVTMQECGITSPNVMIHEAKITLKMSNRGYELTDEKLLN